MSECAEFKSARASNAFLGLGLLIIPVSTVYLTMFGNEDELLHAHVRRGGALIKLIEQTIGWQLFCLFMLAFGIWAAVYSVVSLWKAFDSTPDVAAFDDHLAFHPAVRRTPATYEDVSHWSVEIVSGHPVVWIHLHEPYWSLQGLFRRKTVKLEGDKEQLTPIVEFFSRQPVMREKFVPA